MGFLKVDNTVNEIKALWILVGSAAYFQQEYFPRWLTPECPRIAIPPYREIMHMIPPKALDASYMAPGPSFEITDVTVEIQMHFFEINASLPILRGVYAVGFGFVYLGPYDPINEYAERPGFGLMYYWIERQPDRIYVPGPNVLAQGR